LSQEDVEPLTVAPVTPSNGAMVLTQWQDTVAKTGVPRQIVGDQGADVPAGVTAFCQAPAATSAIDDITHTTACVLKHARHDDAAWQQVTRWAAPRKRKVQHTS